MILTLYDIIYMNMDEKMKLAVYNKEYRIANRERLNENKKKVYQIQKDMMKAKRQIRIICPCGVNVGGKPALIKHQKTFTCINAIANQFFI